MATFINKYFAILISVLFLVTRLINLKVIPIFTDEAIYSYWAQVALHDPQNRYISLEDGKQPLFIWISAAFQKFISDPLVATRLTSVLSGFLATFGIYLLARELFDKKIAKIAVFLYVAFPFTVLYDRMALYDSLLAMLGIFSVYFSVKMAKNAKLDLALLNGITIGLALLTKSSAFIYFLYMPIALLLFDRNGKNLTKRLFTWLYFSSVTFLISQVMYNSLRLSPLYYRIAEKNLEFIRPLREVINNPFQHFFSNLSAITSWLAAYLSWPIMALFIIGTAYLLLKKDIKTLFLSSLIVVPVIAEALFNKVLYPRFMLFYFPPMLILISHTIKNLMTLKTKYLKFIQIAIVVMLIYPITSSILLLISPTQAKIADSDAGQYLNDWPAGYGVKETVESINSKKNSGHVYVATEGTFGLLPYAIQIYFYSDPNVQVQGFYPLDPQAMPKQIEDAKISNTNVLLVLNETQKEVTNPRLNPVAAYQKGRGKSVLRVFEVLPK